MDMPSEPTDPSEAASDEVINLSFNVDRRPNRSGETVVYYDVWPDQRFFEASYTDKIGTDDLRAMLDDMWTRIFDHLSSVFLVNGRRFKGDVTYKIIENDRVPMITAKDLVEGSIAYGVVIPDHLLSQCDANDIRLFNSIGFRINVINAACRLRFGVGAFKGRDRPFIDFSIYCARATQHGRQVTTVHVGGANKKYIQTHTDGNVRVHKDL